MGVIDKSDIDFLNEAVECLSRNPEWTTYRNKEESMIALRSGGYRNQIMVFRIEEKVGTFHGFIGEAPDIVLAGESEV